MATQSSLLAWRIPWTAVPGGLQSIGLYRVGHNLAMENAHSHYCIMIMISVLKVGKLRPRESAEQFTQSHMASGFLYPYDFEWTVVQSLRVCLPMQGMWIFSLVWEDSTCWGATKLMCFNYWSLCNKRSHHNERPKYHSEEEPCPLQLEKACRQQWRPSVAKKQNKTKSQG